MAANKAATPSLTQGPDESPYSYVLRLTTVGTDAAVKAAESFTLSADDAARLHTFEDRVQRSVLAGLTLVARATIKIGSKPTDYAAAATAVGVSSDGGQYLGRKYSTLRECYRLAGAHTPEAAESFVAAFREATGQNPEQVRDYVKWATQTPGNAARFNTVQAIADRKSKSEAAAVKSAADAKTAADRLKTLVTAGRVDGCPLTAAEWAAMPESVLRDVAAYAASLATARGKATRDAARAAAASTAAAETGPTPKRKSRTTVAA